MKIEEIIKELKRFDKKMDVFVFCCLDKLIIKGNFKDFDKEFFIKMVKRGFKNG